MNVFRSILASTLAVAFLFAAAPTASAYHDAQPIFCVGDEGPELPGVCYDPDDFDDCDVYAGLGGGNQVCLVPALGTCPSSTPEWPGVCWTPRQECQLWVGLGGVHCLYPVSASTSTSADVQPPVCQHVVTGPDVHFGVCADPTAECGVWTYNYGSETCHAPGAGVVPRAHCEQLLYGPDIDQGLCYDLDGQYVDGMNCIVWWYSTYSTGQDQCYVPYPPGALALGATPDACVGTGDNTETGVCYEPHDGDGCDAYVTFHHNNRVCILPESAGIAAASTSAAPPRAHCERLLVGPDIDQGLCYDLDGEQVNGRECLVWWYAKYGTGTTVCYVPQPVTQTIDDTCYHVADNPEARSVCHDLSRDTCQVWTENTGRPDRCLT